MRQALLASLDDTPAGSTPPDTRWDPGSRCVKLTLRLSAAHARNLSARARAADSSLGAYVAGLLAGAPPVPLPLNHAEAVACLASSTDQLAMLNADLITFMRGLDAGLAPEAIRHRTDLAALVATVRKHLLQSARLVAALKPARRR